MRASLHLFGRTHTHTHKHTQKHTNTHTNTRENTHTQFFSLAIRTEPVLSGFQPFLCGSHSTELRCRDAILLHVQLNSEYIAHAERYETFDNDNKERGTHRPFHALQVAAHSYSTLGNTCWALEQAASAFSTSEARFAAVVVVKLTPRILFSQDDR